MKDGALVRLRSEFFGVKVKNEIIARISSPQARVENDFSRRIELAAPANINDGIRDAFVSGEEFRSAWISTDREPVAMVSQTPLDSSEGQVQYTIGLFHRVCDSGHYEPWVRHCVA